MTGCDVIFSYYNLLGYFTNRVYEPVELLRRAYELRTGNSFYNVIRQDGTYAKTVHRGLLFTILRDDYRYTLRHICDLALYRSHQPFYHCVSVFQSELTINPTLRRDYESIRAMLSL